MTLDTEGALKDYLHQDAGVVASPCAGRVFLATTSQASFPYVLVTRIGGGDDGSDAPLEQALFQIDIYGRVTQLFEAGTVRAAVIDALNAMPSARYTSAGKARLMGTTVRDQRRLSEPDAQDPDGTVGERPRFVITCQVLGIADA